MGNRKVKWLIYTVLVGLLPVLSRLFVWLVTKSGAVEVEAVTASDFVAFGLVLHISNINEIEHISNVDKAWKTIQNGISIAFIAFYSVLFTLTLLSKDNSLINLKTITICTFSLALVSFLLSYSVFDRISKLSDMNEGK